MVGKVLIDVKETDWFYKVLNEVVERGIIDGYPDGTFKLRTTSQEQSLQGYYIRFRT